MHDWVPAAAGGNEGSSVADGYGSHSPRPPVADPATDSCLMIKGPKIGSLTSPMMAPTKTMVPCTTMRRFTGTRSGCRRKCCRRARPLQTTTVPPRPGTHVRAQHVEVGREVDRHVEGDDDQIEGVGCGRDGGVILDVHELVRAELLHTTPQQRTALDVVFYDCMVMGGGKQAGRTSISTDAVTPRSPSPVPPCPRTSTGRRRGCRARCRHNTQTSIDGWEADYAVGRVTCHPLRCTEHTHRASWMAMEPRPPMPAIPTRLPTAPWSTSGE